MIYSYAIYNDLQCPTTNVSNFPPTCMPPHAFLSLPFFLSFLPSDALHVTDEGSKASL